MPRTALQKGHQNNGLFFAGVGRGRPYRRGDSKRLLSVFDKRGHSSRYSLGLRFFVGQTFRSASLFYDSMAKALPYIQIHMLLYPPSAYSGIIRINIHPPVLGEVALHAVE